MVAANETTSRTTQEEGLEALPATIAAPQALTELASEVMANVQRTQGLRFRSADNLFVLSLLPGNVAQTQFEGDADSRRGTYAIDASDNLLLDFGPDDPWLPMPIKKERDAFVIAAPDADAFVASMVAQGIPREDITDEDIREAFQSWPLRIDQSEEEFTELMPKRVSQ